MAKETIAFIGSTAPSLLPTLSSALKAGHPCRCLARTPSALLSTLKTTYSIPESTLDEHLTIVQGSISSPAAIKTVLTLPSLTPAHPAPVPLIFSALGVRPTGLAFLWTPVTICREGADAVVSALRELQSQSATTLEKKPVFVVLSTTGVSSTHRDVPLAVVPLYYLLGRMPHEDKKDMEAVVTKAAEEGVCRTVIIRPSLLTDGAELGKESVRVGWEEDGGEPAVGYTVSRNDVGAWLYRALVEGGEKGRAEWCGRRVSLTY